MRKNGPKKREKPLPDSPARWSPAAEKSAGTFLYAIEAVLENPKDLAARMRRKSSEFGTFWFSFLYAVLR